MTVASFKGGCGKTTSAVHLAEYLQSQGPTLLIDGDQSRIATMWGQRGTGFSFRITDQESALKVAREYRPEHMVIDTVQRADGKSMRELLNGCELLVIPAVPASLDNDGLLLTLQTVNDLGAKNYRVLLTKVPPPPEKDGPVLRRVLEREGIPLFSVGVPRLKAFEKAAAQGVTVKDVDDRNAAKAWEAYTSAGKEILNG